MACDSFNVFVISEGLNGITRVPKKVFISQNYDTAKLYFRTIIQKVEKPERYYLYKLGELEKGLKFKQMNIFICGGLEETFRRSLEIKKQEDLRKERERYKNAMRAKKTSEQIEILFGGKKYEDGNFEIN